MSKMSSKINNDKTHNTTSMSLIDNSLDKSFCTYLTESKRQYMYKITMVDITTTENVLQKVDGIKCFWCRNPFDSIPIGCPIKYVAHQKNKVIKLPNTGEFYNICESIPSMIATKDCSEHYFETDGIFCSFNCCYAYISDNSHKNLYSMSKFLLMTMLYLANGKYEEYDISNNILKPAPSWKLLKEYGGPLTIEEFRQSFTNTNYYDEQIVHNVPKLKSCAFTYKEKKHI